MLLYVTSWLLNKIIDSNNSFTIFFVQGSDVFVWNIIYDNPPRKLFSQCKLGMYEEDDFF